MELAYHHDCGDPNCSFTTLAAEPLFADEEYQNWVKDIHKNSDTAGLHIPTIQKYAQKFMSALDLSFNAEEKTDQDMLFHLRKNVYHFSAAKNLAELRALTSLIIDDSGKTRSFSKFKKEAVKVTDKFQNAWLKAEYELAFAGGQMASKWQEFEKTGENTLLIYRTIKDARVSNICKPLEGVIKPLNDAFWNTYYPPNHYSCRCDVDRLASSAQVTKNEAIEYPEIPKMLQTNLAKSKLVFPENHPYFVGFKDTVSETLIENPLIPSNIEAYEKKSSAKINREFFEYLKNPTPLKIDGKKEGAFYYPAKNEVHIPLVSRRFASKWYSNSIIYHEFGHAIDWHHDLRTQNSVAEVMNKHIKLLRANKNEGFRSIDKRLKDLYQFAWKKNRVDLKEQLGSTADTLMSLNSTYGWGHTKTYYKKNGFRQAEFLAHMFENVFAGNPVFKKVMPELYDDTLKLWEKLKKEVILK